MSLVRYPLPQPRAQPPRAARIIVVGGLTSSVNCAGAAASVGGGSGTWSNVGNATGAPDGATADWTAP